MTGLDFTALESESGPGQAEETLGVEKTWAIPKSGHQSRTLEGIEGLGVSKVEKYGME